MTNTTEASTTLGKFEITSGNTAYYFTNVALKDATAWNDHAFATNTVEIMSSIEDPRTIPAYTRESNLLILGVATVGISLSFHVCTPYYSKIPRPSVRRGAS